MWIIFKVNNKDTRTTSWTSLCTLNILHTFFLMLILLLWIIKCFLGRFGEWAEVARVAKFLEFSQVYIMPKLVFSSPCHFRFQDICPSLFREQISGIYISQLIFPCSKSTIETLGKVWNMFTIRVNNKTPKLHP